MIREHSYSRTPWERTDSLNIFVLLLQAIHPFTAASEKELSLGVGDYVVVRKVCYISFLRQMAWLHFDGLVDSRCKEIKCCSRSEQDKRNL